MRPKTSETLDTGEDLLIRFDPETGELTGLTILNFSELGKEIELLINEKNVEPALM